MLPALLMLLDWAAGEAATAVYQITTTTTVIDSDEWNMRVAPSTMVLHTASGASITTTTTALMSDSRRRAIKTDVSEQVVIDAG